MTFRSRFDKEQELRPVVHFVALATHDAHSNLLGTVMLNGWLVYDVVLAEDFIGPWPELPRAHLYNVKSRTVVEMVPQRPRIRRTRGSSQG